jgi:RimJ/RimL family protein N-acetyltransferase
MGVKNLIFIFSEFQMMKIFYLPVQRWKEYKKIRLLALEEEKFAFSKSYNEEKDKASSFWKSRIGSRAVICAENDGKLIGITAFIRGSSAATSHTGEIVAVYVIPEMRRKKVAKKIFDFILKDAKKTKIKKIKIGVFSNNLPAKEFYLKQGFKIVGKHEKEFFVDGKYYDETLMELFL